MKFLKEDLVELAYFGEPEGFEVVLDEVVDTSRWLVHYRMVFTYDGKYYETTYSKGATEYQDGRPYDDEGDEVECQEVMPVAVTIVKYVPV